MVLQHSMGFGAAAASSRGIHKEATRRPFDSLGSELNHLATTTLCSNIVGIIYDALVVTHTSTHLRSSTMCSVIIKVGSSVNFFSNNHRAHYYCYKDATRQPPPLFSLCHTRLLLFHSAGQDWLVYLPALLSDIVMVCISVQFAFS